MSQQINLNNMAHAQTVYEPLRLELFGTTTNECVNFVRGSTVLLCTENQDSIACDITHPTGEVLSGIRFSHYELEKLMVHQPNAMERWSRYFMHSLLRSARSAWNYRKAS